MIYIVILNWNDWVSTKVCLESILRSQFKLYKIILIDNGSNDSSVLKISAWLKSLKSKYLEVDSLKLKPDKSFSIFHLNIHSVQAHISDLRVLLGMLDFDFDFTSSLPISQKIENMAYKLEKVRNVFYV